MALPLSCMEAHLGADLLQELQPPCLLSSIGKTVPYSGKFTKTDEMGLDLSSSASTASEVQKFPALWDETPTCSLSSFTDSPRRAWRDLSPMKVPLPDSYVKEMLSGGLPMRVERMSQRSRESLRSHDSVASDAARVSGDATREGCLPALAAWAAQEARAGRFTCLSTTPDAREVPSLPPRPSPAFPAPAWPCPFEAPPALPVPPPPSAPAEESRRRGKTGAYAAKFVFSGFDAQHHADFELVPRLIGRKGCNLRPISQGCRGKIRVTGWDGSQPMKFGSKSSTNDSPVEVTLTCHDQPSLDEGIRQLRVLLEDLSVQFERNDWKLHRWSEAFMSSFSGSCYCYKRGITPVPDLYHLTL
ncbi:unnamed protein product [Effrenium voratum]|nr:unnamed protein product [Effrenium voratum]